MTPPTPEQIAALEQWARDRGARGLDLAMMEATVALCETVRAQQADIDQRTQAWAIAADERDRANGEKDAAVARAEQAERDKQTLAEVAAQHLKDRDAARAEVAHERLRYDGMRSDRDDWRQRAEQAQAEVAQARAELEQLRTAAASGWGEPTLVNMLKVENATLRAEIQSVRALLAEIAQEGR